MKDMKARIVEVVSDFVEVDEDLGVEVSMTQDPELQGTMYAVSIPVRQVKPEFDVENEKTYGWDEEPIYDDDACGGSEARVSDRFPGGEARDGRGRVEEARGVAAARRRDEVET